MYPRVQKLPRVRGGSYIGHLLNCSLTQSSCYLLTHSEFSGIWHSTVTKIYTGTHSTDSDGDGSQRSQGRGHSTIDMINTYLLHIIVCYSCIMKQLLLTCWRRCSFIKRPVSRLVTRSLTSSTSAIVN